MGNLRPQRGCWFVQAQITHIRSSVSAEAMSHASILQHVPAPHVIAASHMRTSSSASGCPHPCLQNEVITLSSLGLNVEWRVGWLKRCKVGLPHVRVLGMRSRSNSTCLQFLGNPTNNGNVGRFCLMPCVDFQVLRKMQRRHSSNTDNGPPER